MCNLKCPTTVAAKGRVASPNPSTEHLYTALLYISVASVCFSKPSHRIRLQFRWVGIPASQLHVKFCFLPVQNFHYFYNGTPGQRWLLKCGVVEPEAILLFFIDAPGLDATTQLWLSTYSRSYRSGPQLSWHRNRNSYVGIPGNLGNERDMGFSITSPTRESCLWFHIAENIHFRSPWPRQRSSGTYRSRWDRANRAYLIISQVPRPLRRRPLPFGGRSTKAVFDS
ncbi:hypothetical protein K440DRAFT_205598 [Wilcoxina mikolae CBS 423.85]|nr:hypothetical protein K440DRAFT_205598 [Wilcoxina mikolae CBS 423.85]